MKSLCERLFLLSIVLLAGCETTEHRAPIVSDSARIRTARPARAWEVQHRGEAVGQVVFFEDRGDQRGVIYAVRNLWHQDLGVIDALGRAYRYLPHHLEPAWVGTGTVAQGVARILGLPEQECGLEEVELPKPESASIVPESP